MGKKVKRQQENKQVKDEEEVREDVLELKNATITKETLIGALGVGAIVWFWWLHVYILFLYR